MNRQDFLFFLGIGLVIVSPGFFALTQTVNLVL